MEHIIDGKADQRVAEPVERPLVFGEVRGRQAVADDHVDLVVEDFGRHGGSGIGRVRVVAVDHDVALGVDILEHAADHVPLPLLGFRAHDSAGGTGNDSGVVGGVVVIDVNDCFGQDRLPVGDDLLDGLCFVVAGY